MGTKDEDLLDIEVIPVTKVRELSPYISLMTSIRTHSITGVPNEMALKPLTYITYNPLELQFCYNIPTKVPHLTFSIGLRLAQEAYRKTSEVYLKDSQVFLKDQNFKSETDVSSCDEDTTSFLIRRNIMDFRANYIELLFPELRFNTSRKAPKSGFSVTLGSIFGMRVGQPLQQDNDEEDNELKANTESEFWNLHQLRFGFTVRIAWERVNIFYTQMLTGLFQEGTGLCEDRIMPWSIGVGLSLI